jgi:hypothetical protein
MPAICCGLNGVEQHDVDDAEQKQSHRIVLPPHRAVAVDTANGINSTFDQAEEPQLTVENTSHVDTERNTAAQHKHKDEGDVAPTGECHIEYP